MIGQAMQIKANQGDVCAMYVLRRYHARSRNGIAQDRVHSCAWFKRAAELHQVEGMVSFGQLLLEGIVGPSLPAFGVLYTFGEAKRGSEEQSTVLNRRSCWDNTVFRRTARRLNVCWY